MESLPQATEQDFLRYQKWWEGLSDLWKTAFNEAHARRTTTEQLPDYMLHAIWTGPILRMAGPGAMFPNLSMELVDLSGIKDLKHLEILILTNHKITTLKGLEQHKNLKSLFIFSNKLTSIEEIKDLEGLKELYINANFIASLTPLEKLVNLEVIHCAHNSFNSFEGVGTQHKALREFICLPNEDIWEAEVLRFEKETNIHCKKG